MDPFVDPLTVRRGTFLPFSVVGDALKAEGMGKNIEDGTERFESYHLKRIG